MQKLSINDMTLCSMFAALSAVLSQIMVPIGPVPITLTHISIFMAAGLLGAKKAALSQTVYVLLGSVGLPVFAGLTGGIGALLGPRGGFIVGYIACAFIVGLIVECFGITMKALIPAMTSGLTASYTLGLLWYMFITKTGLYPALSVCVFPFLMGDFMKIVLCSVLVRMISPAIQNYKNTQVPLE